MRIYLQYEDRIVAATGLFDHLPKVGGAVYVDGKKRRVVDISHHMEDTKDLDLVRLGHIMIHLGAAW